MSTAQGERRLRLAATRSLLYSLPPNELFELPGRPHVVYQLRTYSNTGNAEEAAQQARLDSPFLFKAFETGQIGPKRLARMHGDKPRVATIHEYLDWTVTAQAAEGDDELDFDGFRVLVILPRYRSGWPPPGGEVTTPDEPRKARLIGAPKSPLPALQSHGKPVTAATIRSGPGYLEVPFVATHENKRGRGYCRCLVEAIEEIARALGLQKLMLCSTNDASVQSTWQHLGFGYASDEQMEEWDILHTDLVYLQNTTQMHKDVPPHRRLKPVLIKHEAFRQRCYAFVGQKRPQHTAGSLHAASLPQASRPRLSSKRSESTSRDESQSVAAREHPSAAGEVGPAEKAGSVAGHPLQLDESSPIAVGALAVTAQAAASVTGRMHGRLPTDEVGRTTAGLARDEGIAGGGPPTPQPADAGHLRPLHVHATSDVPSASQTNVARPVRSSAADSVNGLALSGPENTAICDRSAPGTRNGHGILVDGRSGPAAMLAEAKSAAIGAPAEGRGMGCIHSHGSLAATGKAGLGHGKGPSALTTAPSSGLQPRLAGLPRGGHGACFLDGMYNFRLMTERILYDDNWVPFPLAKLTELTFKGSYC
ncbi:hypothetical protein VOLCADRAFT_103694 [Volvox carteri f. nagariensis]|uniref:N-acetyltransferase domain-containing protein n=1 Tax=Volvox carteri f. nagariensis TaxID=3068 RepID=D8TNU2_VOLCA|nr:uncharacterized protein VOLCADRAFT_103694 [Volvox carteri f. nagariensis]EFJ50901.1 hypothetical protein VOLCADRAFT_103694 [Volvox carteri f. nagariensis]|eukprot:XP_002947913.1 hypothetical protein VOLCADRAFT_103694 [Volvox carteri f. nagariensis]